MIRNLTIRNRDSHRLVFLNFLLWVKELVNSDCRFGFLVKNLIYSQLEMSRISKFDRKIRNSLDSGTEKCNFLSYVSTVCGNLETNKGNLRTNKGNQKNTGILIKTRLIRKTRQLVFFFKFWISFVSCFWLFFGP